MASSNAQTLSPIPLRAGSRSPSSMPSSPTSIRSASSAIFERDIEPLTPPHPNGLHNPHRTPRTTQTEQAVPSVLAEAAAALAEPTENVSILAPVPSPLTLQNVLFTGSTSPSMAKSRSRSSSPVARSRHRTPAASPVPSPRTATAPLPPLPQSAHGSPRRPTANAPPASYSPPSIHASPSLRPTNDDAAANALSSLHIDPSSLPPPHTSPSKRLSFISYSDILSSAPITATPLASLTTNPVPPPHLPTVAHNVPGSSPSSTYGGAPSRPLSTYSIGTSANVNNRNSIFHLQPIPSDSNIGEAALSDAVAQHLAAAVKDDRRHSTHSTAPGDDLVQRLADDIGGEWEREGLGKGLEARLESVA